MPDPARTAEARVLEVPVTIQGSKIVAGSDHRELFTESTKTEMVLDNGALIHLKARVVAGQSLFLRNEQTGREILCKVVDAPAEGETGPTDLQFTVANPEFWGAEGKQSEAAVEQPAPISDQAAPAVEKSEPPQENRGAEAPQENLLAMMSATAATMTVPPARLSVQEELMAAHEAAPESSATGAPSGPANEAVIPAHEQATVQTTARAQGQDGAPSRPEPEPEFNAEKFEEHLAALLEGDHKRAKRVTATKEKEAAKAAATGAPQAAPGDASAGALAEGEIFPPKPTLEQILTTGRGAIIVEIAASVVIAVCLFFIWRAIHNPYAYGGLEPVAVSAPPKTKAPAVAGGVPGAAAKNPGKSAGKASAQVAGNGKQPRATQSPAIPVAKNPIAALSPADAERGSKPVASSPGEEGPRVVVSRNAIRVDTGSEEASRKSLVPNASGSIPARIVSQVQPVYPSWAKELDVDGVVKLEATIDEKGNVTQTKVLSGPRPLQHAAEQALGLWIFEPAQQDGKPVASHMILSVEFQR